MPKEIAGLIRVKDVDRVVAILCNAFSQYPKFVKAFPNEERRKKIAEIEFRLQGTYGMGWGRAYGLSNTGHGVAIVLPSNKVKPSKVKYFLAGCYSKEYRRLLAELTEEECAKRDQLLEEIKAMESEIEFPKKYLYVSFLGVEKAYRGQGEGSAILEKIIEEGQRKALPIVFYTSEPKSVAFYQKLGFKVMGITSSKEFEFINIYLIKI